MRDKNFNTGVRRAARRAGHYERMGSAITAFLVAGASADAPERISIGWVLGGVARCSYREIEEGRASTRRTLEGWFRRFEKRRLHRDHSCATMQCGTKRITEGQKIFTDHPQLQSGYAGLQPYYANCVATTPKTGKFSSFSPDG